MIQCRHSKGRELLMALLGNMSCWMIADWILEGNSEGSITFFNVHILWPSNFTPRNLSHGNTCTRNEGFTLYSTVCNNMPLEINAHE